MNNFEQGMHKNDANFVPLTPISFLDRIKDVYPDYEAIVYKERKYSGDRFTIDVLDLPVLNQSWNW